MYRRGAGGWYETHAILGAGRSLTPLSPVHQMKCGFTVKRTHPGLPATRQPGFPASSSPNSRAILGLGSASETGSTTSIVYGGKVISLSLGNCERSETSAPRWKASSLSSTAVSSHSRLGPLLSMYCWHTSFS